MLAAGRSLLAFGAGLVLASCYGATALFLHGAPLWTCIYGTLAVAIVTAFGMGMFVRVRAAISLMLPSICSGQCVSASRLCVCACVYIR